MMMMQKTWRAAFTTASLVALFGAGAAAGLASTKDSQQEGSVRTQAPFRSPVLTALDTDADGALSAAEQAQAVQSLTRLDGNRDGALSGEELRPAGGPGGSGPGRRGRPRGDAPGEAPSGAADDLTARIMAFDKDGDGKVARAELPERMQGIMARADANKDGALTAAELKDRAARPSPAAGDRARGDVAGGRDGRRGRGPGGWPRDPVSRAIDANSDGTIAADEIAAAASALRALDADFDGRISAEEIRPAAGRGVRRGQ